MTEPEPARSAALEKPYAEQARRVEQETQGHMRIDPVTGNVSIGTPTEQPEQPEQEPVAWDKGFRAGWEERGRYDQG
jgi:hypothetical protein